MAPVCKTDSITPFRFTTIQFRCLNGPVLVHCGKSTLALFFDLFTQALGLQWPPSFHTHSHPVLVVAALLKTVDGVCSDKCLSFRHLITCLC